MTRQNSKIHCHKTHSNIVIMIRENFSIKKVKQNAKVVYDFGVKPIICSVESFGQLFTRLTDHKYVDNEVHGHVDGPANFRGSICQCTSCSITVSIYDNFQERDPIAVDADLYVTEVMKDLENDNAKHVLVVVFTGHQSAST